MARDAEEASKLQKNIFLSTFKSTKQCWMDNNGVAKTNCLVLLTQDQLWEAGHNLRRKTGGQGWHPQYPGLPVTELVCNNGITESFESSSAIMFPVRNEIKRAKDENVKPNPVRTLDLGGRQFDRDVCTRLSCYLQHLSLQVKRSSKIHQHLPSNIIMHCICIFKGFETKKFTSKSLFLLLSTHLAGPQV